MPTPDPGLYPAVPFAEYRAWEALNQSVLSHARRSMLHLRWFMEHPPEPSAAMSFGELAHSYILEPEAMLERYVSYEKVPWNTKEGREQKGAVMALAAEGKRPITSAELLACKVMRHRVLSHPVARDLILEVGANEVSAVWRDKFTNLLCKGRMDRWLSERKTILELKTARDASTSGFARAVGQYAYHVQAAFYQDALQTLLGINAVVRFIVVENEPPHGVAVYQLDAEAEAAGRQVYQEALEEYQDAVRLNRWLGYPDTVQILSLPRWALPADPAESTPDEF